MSTFLVTGGTGRIGTECIAQLASQGHSVKFATRNPKGAAAQFREKFGPGTVNAVGMDGACETVQVLNLCVRGFLDSERASWSSSFKLKRKPDYKLYESHPVVNSLILYHAGHGDVRIRPDIERFEGRTVHFKDGTRDEYDMVLAATGYKLDYPFIDNALLNWQGDAPHLYLNCMHPGRDDLFVLGMVEASGLGWQGRHEQAEMVVRYIKGLREGSAAAQALQARKAAGFSRATGGMNYIDLPRMAYYVDKATYRKAVGRWIARLAGGRT